MDASILNHFVHCVDPPEFSFNGVKCWARLLDVYDGDTVTVGVPISSICGKNDNAEFRKINIRVLGIDTPEIKSKDKEAALEARNTAFTFLTGLEFSGKIKDQLASTNCIVWIELGKNDKYGGRYLGIVRKEENGMSLSQFMLNTGMAKYYNGGTKTN
jgi:endonuclease YncB( thermonuclease family)